MRIIFTTLLIAYWSLSSSQEWQVRTISNDGFKPALIIDDLDRVHMVYMTEAVSGWVRYALVEDQNVSESMVSTGYFYGPPDITFDTQNNPVIAYHDHDTEDQAVRRWDGGQWVNIDTRHDGHDGWDNAAIVDRNGNIHTSSVNPFGGPGIEYGMYDGQSWTVEAIGSGPIMYANATGIALTSENQVYISYFNDGLSILQVANNVGGSWSIEDVDAMTSGGRFSSILIDELDNVYVSYYTESGEIRLAGKINGIWSTQTIDVLEDLEIGFSGARNITSLAQHNGILYLAYGDKSVIKLATISVQVDIDIVASKQDQDFGQIVSLDMNSSGTPYVAFSGSNPDNNPLGNIFLAVGGSGTTASSSLKRLNRIKVFPQPAQQGKPLYLAMDESLIYYTIYNMLGHPVQSGLNLSDFIILDTDLNTGAYLLKLYGGTASDANHVVIIVD